MAHLSTALAQNSEPLNPDQQQAINHLMLLDEEAEAFTFQTFSDRKQRGGPDPLARVINGELLDVWGHLVDLNRRGAGVFVTVNETNGKGREGSDITRIRGVWQEDDGEGQPLPLEPHIVIESSPGKHHRYLLVDGLELDEFEPLQQTLVDEYGSDPAAKDRSRVLRLAGFFHQKREPHMVRIVEHSGMRPYDRDAILKAFPPKPNGDARVNERTLDSGLWVPAQVVTDLRSALNHVRSDDRELWVRMGHALHELGDTGRGLWLDWSQTSDSFDPINDPKQWDTFKPTRTGYQAVFKAAQDAGWVNPLANHAGGDEDAGTVPLHTWPELADPFAEHVTPHFPLDCLPDAFAKFARQYAKQSGFDAGAYGFCLLVAAGNLIDHRSRLSVTDTFRVPPNLWGGLVDASGGGKSPTISAGTAALHAINDEVVSESSRDYSQWLKDCGSTPKNEQPERPPWRQIIALDTTVEANGDLAKDNPEGIIIVADELTEVIGRMDAYSGKGGGKDRAVYLRAFDGGPQTINRRSGIIRVENFSLGIIAGIQPPKLAELYKRGGGGDGLYQRFVFYSMQPAGLADYGARIGPFTDANVRTLFDAIAQQRITTALATPARQAMNEYHNQVRALSMRTPGQRLAEHLNKFPGFINRIAFVLHVIESITTDNDPRKPLSLETWQRAKSIMACLYRHSEAVYALLDEQAADAIALGKSAAEAILSKRWERFKRGDLTRHATGWRGASPQLADGAIDILIELGWIKDVTVTDQKKRGRPSDGTFIVNPAVAAVFSDHARRITAARAVRFAAIQAVAGTRSGDSNP